MKWLLFTGLLIAGLLGAVQRIRAQSYEIQQLVLDIEKLKQLKQILQDLKDGYQALDKGYSAIRDISQGNFDLHKAFLDGLLAVSPAVKSYKRVADIIQLQASVANRYKSVWSKFQQDSHFRPEEIVVMGTVYGNLLTQSLKDLESLIAVVTDGELRASDAERLRQIDGIYAGMQEKSIFLDQFNNSGMILSMQRAADDNDLQGIRKLYGITTQ